MTGDKKPSVGIAISAVGNLPQSFFKSFVPLLINSIDHGFKVDVIIDDSKPLDKSRNKCVKRLLKRGFDYIFFVDADMVFPPDALVKLLKQDKEIISGVYCARNKPFLPILRMWAEKDKKKALILVDYPRGKIFKVGATGAGCLLIKKKVLEDLKEPWFKWDDELSEDLYFCFMATQKGYDIWAHGGVECGHIAEQAFVFPKMHFKKIDSLKKKLDTPEGKAKCVFYDQSGEEPKE